MPITTRNSARRAAPRLGTALALIVTSSILRAAEAAPLLVAVEPSDFKNAVAQGLATDLHRAGHAVRTVTLDQLETENAAAYRVIVILDTCRAFSPTRRATRYVSRLDTSERRKVVMFTTAASGNCPADIEHVDAVSTASRAAGEAHDVIQMLHEHVRARLAPPPATP
jgi:hypothetical protein